MKNNQKIYVITESELDLIQKMGFGFYVNIFFTGVCSSLLASAPLFSVPWWMALGGSCMGCLGFFGAMYARQKLLNEFHERGITAISPSIPIHESPTRGTFRAIKEIDITEEEMKKKNGKDLLH